MLGVVSFAKLFPINILQSRVEYPDGNTIPVVRIDGPREQLEVKAVLVVEKKPDTGAAA